MTIAFEIFLLMTLVGSVTDVCSRRIPNVLTYGGMGVVFVASAFQGPAALGFALLWCAATITVGSIVFGKGWIGGGDIKLMAAGAAAIGYPSFLIVLFYIAIAGGVLAAVAAARAHRLRDTFVSIAVSAVSGTTVVPHPASNRIPYALAICAGSFSFAASESIAPWLRFAH